MSSNSYLSMNLLISFIPLQFDYFGLDLFFLRFSDRGKVSHRTPILYNIIIRDHHSLYRYTG